VSIAADTMGTLICISVVNLVLISISLGKTSEYEGIRRTSSKVRASVM